MFGPGPAPAGINQLQQLFLRIIGFSVTIGFIVLLVMLIIGGVKYLTSGGDQKALTSARQTLTWAIIGMILFAVAWVVLLLVGAFTYTNQTDFCISNC